MARYIDADALKERLREIRIMPNTLYGMGINAGIDKVVTAIEAMPIADVVPKSGSLPLDVHEALKQRAVEKAKAEVAREIFEEIERALDNYHYSNLLVGEIYPISYYDAELEDAIAELKKKYTEGEPNG